MSMTQAALVIRKDLLLPEGLLAAQAAHIGDGWVRNRIIAAVDMATAGDDIKPIHELFKSEEVDWMRRPYVAVLAVQTREELEHVYRKALDNSDLTVTKWTDTIYMPTFEKVALPDIFVGFSIGPGDADAIRRITGNLPLY